MSIAQENLKTLTRPGGHPLGIHRVVSPRGVLPQAAERLDTSLPIYSDEVLIEVERLQIDSASLEQLKREANNSPEKIMEQIRGIVLKSGKLHNPVTGSGGILSGRVIQVGRESPCDFSLGDRVVTLVSLSLTPLTLEKIISVDLKSGQALVQGKAILFASGIAAKFPPEMEQMTALALFDVCGAPAWVHRKLSFSDKVLILGAGKAGVLSALAALEVVSPQAVWLSDICEEALGRVRRYGWGVNTFCADARDAVKFQEILGVQKISPFDLVVDACNVPETEMASILATRPGGRIIFFNMATQFSRGVLSAEGIGRDVELIMGNGYAEGHSGFALQLFQKHPEIQSWFRDSGLRERGGYAASLH